MAAIHFILELDRLTPRLEKQRKDRLKNGLIFPKVDRPLESEDLDQIEQGLCHV